MKNRKIQVVPDRVVRTYLPFMGPGYFMAETWPYLQSIASHAYYTNRTPEIEADERLRQIIPYGILRRRDSREVLTYARSGRSGEGRLMGKYSIGFGGHLDMPDDWRDRSTAHLSGDSVVIGAASSTRTEDIIYEWWAGLRRELAEECRVPADTPIEYLGLIDDRSDAVGRVHLGICCIVHVPDDWKPITNDEIMSPVWMTRDMIAEAMDSNPDVWENWSCLAVGWL